MSEEKNLQETMRQFGSIKALQLLVALANGGGKPVTLAELSAETGIPTSSAYRILQEMCQCGFAIKDEEIKSYQPGFEARLLAMQLQKTNFLYEAAKTEMAYLNDLSLETIHLIGEENMEAVYLAKLGAKNSVGMRSRVGRHVPMYCTGGGKAILAWKPEGWLERYLEWVKLEQFTSQTLVDVDALRRELQVIRIQGYAVDNHEHHTDVVCISAPIFDVNNMPIASISISAPEYRFSLERALSYSVPLLQSVNRITEKLGGSYPIRIVKQE